jgi:hypothetical protein
LSSGYTAGQALYLGENGALTTTKPSAPEHLVYIGVVVRATNNGIIYVATQNGYELDELHNVAINTGTLASGHSIVYNSSSGVWENAFVPRLSVSDTAPASPNTGDLWFNSSNARLFSYYDSTWVEISGPRGPAGPAQFANVASSAPSSPQTGQLWYNTSNATLNVYDGSSWNAV